MNSEWYVLDLHALDGVAFDVFDCTENKTRLAFRIMRHGITVCHRLCLMRMKGTEDRTFGGRRGLGMVDCVNEKGKAKNVGEEDKFLQCPLAIPLINLHIEASTYMSHVTANLPNSN